MVTLPLGPPKYRSGIFSGRPALYQKTPGFKISCPKIPATPNTALKQPFSVPNSVQSMRQCADWELKPVQTQFWHTR